MQQEYNGMILPKNSISKTSFKQHLDVEDLIRGIRDISH